MTPGKDGVQETLEAGNNAVYTQATHGGSFSAMAIVNGDSSPEDVLAFVTDSRTGMMHTNGARIPPGGKEYFRCGNGNIKSVVLVGEGAIVDWFSVSTTSD